MKEKNINIYVCMYFLLFLIIPVTILDPIAPKLYDLFKLFSVSIMLLCICIQFFKNKRMDYFDLVMFANMVVLLLISAIKGTLNYNISFSIIELFAIAVFLKNSFYKSYNSFKALYCIYVIIVIVNFITFFYKINFNYLSYYFIGGKNAISLTIIPAMLVIHMYSLLNYNRITTFNGIILILCILSLFISKSSTAIIVAFITTIGYFLIFSKKINISLKKYILLYLSIFFIVLFCTSILEKSFFGSMIENMFNKDITFSNRSELWNFSYKYFLNSKIFGYGKGNKIIYDFTNGLLSQSHNMVLELLLTGGIVSLILFLLVIYISNFKLDYKNNIDKIVLFYLFIYCIIGLTESIVFSNQLWMIFSIGYSIEKLRDHYKKN